MFNDGDALGLGQFNWVIQLCCSVSSHWSRQNRPRVSKIRLKVFRRGLIVSPGSCSNNSPVSSFTAATLGCESQKPRLFGWVTDRTSGFKPFWFEVVKSLTCCWHISWLVILLLSVNVPVEKPWEHHLILTRRFDYSSLWDIQCCCKWIFQSGAETGPQQTDYDYYYYSGFQFSHKR